MSVCDLFVCCNCWIISIKRYFQPVQMYVDFTLTACVHVHNTTCCPINTDIVWLIRQLFLTVFVVPSLWGSSWVTVWFSGEYVTHTVQPPFTPLSLGWGKLRLWIELLPYRTPYPTPVSGCEGKLLLWRTRMPFKCLNSRTTMLAQLSLYPSYNYAIAALNALLLWLHEILAAVVYPVVMIFLDSVSFFFCILRSPY